MKSIDLYRLVLPARHAWRYFYPAVVTVAVVVAVGCSTVAAFWLASFLLAASAHHNPLHAGLWGWWDAMSAWHEGGLPRAGRRIAGAAVLGCLLAFGGPPLAWWAIRNGTGRRALYGSAQFATEADIRRAGLL